MDPKETQKLNKLEQPKPRVWPLWFLSSAICVMGAVACLTFFASTPGGRVQGLGAGLPFGIPIGCMLAAGMTVVFIITKSILGRTRFSKRSKELTLVAPSVLFAVTIATVGWRLGQQDKWMEKVTGSPIPTSVTDYRIEGFLGYGATRTIARFRISPEDLDKLVARKEMETSDPFSMSEIALRDQFLKDFDLAHEISEPVKGSYYYSKDSGEYSMAAKFLVFDEETEIAWFIDSFTN